MEHLSPFTVSGGTFIGTGGHMDLMNGTLVTDLTNSGLLTMGAGSALQSYLIQGNFTQTSTGYLLLDSQISATDLLLVSGRATLAGTFELDDAAGTGPGPGDILTPLSYGSRTGTFDT